MVGCVDDVGAADAARQVMSAPPAAWHQPVMPKEVLHFLNATPGAAIVDATTGTGGHSHLIIQRLLPNGRLIAIDQDAGSLEIARQRLAEFEPLVITVQDNFRDLARILDRLGHSRVNGVLLDLGMSSPQVDEAARGFSFAKEGPLDMRMNPQDRLTAATLINERSVEELAHLLRVYGEERFAHRIAHHVVEARRRQPILTTTHLARLIVDAVPPPARHGRLHPATRTFQALRIAVNDELGALEECLQALPDALAPAGRAVVLTYHSLEDRLVKRAFVEGARRRVWRVLTKHVVRPSPEEVTRNPRARSAKLRAIERL